jgi:hypothetical protein
MANTTATLMNDYLGALGIKAIDAPRAHYFLYINGDGVVTFQAKVSGKTIQDRDGDGFIEHVVLHTLQSVTLSGGNLYVRRALANSEATTLKQLDGEIQTAPQFSLYMESKAIIDALIALNPQSAFAAGWLITQLQAEALGLDQWSRGSLIRRLDTTVDKAGSGRSKGLVREFDWEECRSQRCRPQSILPIML